MANEPTTASNGSESLQSARVYAMAVICLVAGLAFGYVLRGSKSPVSPTQPFANVVPADVPAGTMAGRQTQTAVNARPPSAPMSAMSGGRMPSQEEMKRMADKQAAPLLQKLKSEPNNSALLVQIGAIYHATHQFKQAAAYYGKAVQIDPGNVAVRTKLASSLYRGGDIDGAIAQLNQALGYDPKDANALFDLGMIKMQGKGDGKGALAAWQRLLKTNPQLSEDRKAMVLKLMAEVQTTLGDQHGMGGARSNDGHSSNSK
jgi:cytochrome c-type biogenesis protein CcmH/NrfG